MILFLVYKKSCNIIHNHIKCPYKEKIARKSGSRLFFPHFETKNIEAIMGVFAYGYLLR